MIIEGFSKGLVGLLVAIACPLLSENPKDSLLEALNQTSTPFLRMSLYGQLSQETYSQSLRVSLTYADSSVIIARNIGDQAGIAVGQFRRGYALVELGQTPDAIEAAKEASEIFGRLGDSIALAGANNLLGIIYLRMDSTDKALSLLFEASKLAEQIGDYSLAASSFNNIGEIYNYASDYKTARFYYKKSLDNILKTNETYKKTIVLMNYANMQDSWDEKVTLLKQVVDLAEEGPFPKSLAYALGSLGDSYGVDSNQYSTALIYYKAALDNARLSEDRRMIVHNLLYAASCWLELGRIDSAEVYLDAIDIEDLEENYLRKYFYYLAQLTFVKGDEKKAYVLLDSSLKMHTKYFDAELANQISEANAKFEAEKKESEIIRQQLLIEREKRNRNTIIFISAGMLGLIVLLGQVWLTRFRKKKKDIELALQLEKERVKNLQEVSDTKERIFNNLSHELKTPLTMVIGPLENSVSQVRNLQLKENIGLALRSGRKLNSLVNEILDLARLDQGKLPVNNQVIEIREFLMRTFNAFSSLAATQYVNMSHNLLHCPEILIETDPEKLEKILNNLILNALKFSHSRSEIFLDFRKERILSGILEVTIKDEGIGIKEPNRIFDRYYQGPESNSGSGIGLSLVKEYCELLGGKASVKSVVGSGSVFTIEIPAILVTKDQAMLKRDSRKDSHVEGTVSTLALSGDILIVEDDPQMGQYIKNLLSSVFDCRLVYNGLQALEFLELHRCDLIISDIMMPEMDGFELRKKINDHPRLSAIPFIMLTARSLEADKIYGFRLGVDDYITKPFLPAELMARVRNLLQNKTKREQIEKEEAISFEADLILRAEQFVRSHLDNSNFRIVDLANHLNYSVRQLGRLLKGITGMTPVEMVLEIRLKTAYDWLSMRKFKTIGEVHLAVGIDSGSYFTKKFQERFGIKPSEVFGIN